MIEIRTTTPRIFNSFIIYVKTLQTDKTAALAISKHTNAKKWAKFATTCKKGSFLVIADKKKIVGHCNLFRKKDKIEVGIALLRDYRRKGIAKAALKKILNWAKKRRIKKVYAGIKKKNLRSIHFFKSAGFKIVKSRKNSYLLRKNL